MLIMLIFKAYPQNVINSITAPGTCPACFIFLKTIQSTHFCLNLEKMMSKVRSRASSADG